LALNLAGIGDTEMTGDCIFAYTTLFYKIPPIFCFVFVKILWTHCVAQQLIYIDMPT
jgi:hypothetical protein